MWHGIVGHKPYQEKISQHNMCAFCNLFTKIIFFFMWICFSKTGWVCIEHWETSSHPNPCFHLNKVLHTVHWTPNVHFVTYIMQKKICPWHVMSQTYSCSKTTSDTTQLSDILFGKGHVVTQAKLAFCSDRYMKHCSPSLTEFVGISAEPHIFHNTCFSEAITTHVHNIRAAAHTCLLVVVPPRT